MCYCLAKYFFCFSNKTTSKTSNKIDSKVSSKSNISLTESELNLYI